MCTLESLDICVHTHISIHTAYRLSDSLRGTGAPSCRSGRSCCVSLSHGHYIPSTLEIPITNFFDVTDFILYSWDYTRIGLIFESNWVWILFQLPSYSHYIPIPSYFDLATWSFLMCKPRPWLRMGRSRRRRSDEIHQVLSCDPGGVGKMGRTRYPRYPQSMGFWDLGKVMNWRIYGVLTV